MLSRLPHEVRLQIFHCVFKSGYEYQEVIRVEDTAEGITYKFTNGVHRRTLSGAISCIDAAIVGEGIAAAAAEALYQSQFHFAVDAKVLCAFLRSCPLSLLVEPGKYIKKLHLYMDEDPKFIGDGKDGHALRKADWVDLVPDASDDRVTRLGHRTQRMRQCWRAILLMPKLEWFEFWIMPSQGKVSANDIQRWEIRDIIPTHFRLCRKRVCTSIYLRTWENHRKPMNDLDYVLDTWEYLSDPNSVQQPDDDGFYESYLDLDSCVPFHWREPADDERILAENASARQDRWTLPPWDGSHDSLKCHRVPNYEAMCELKDRLIADKSTSIIHDFMPIYLLTHLRL